jgi:hypothetical protein
MSDYNPKIHHRGSMRPRGYDYSRPGYYFVTICLHDIRCTSATARQKAFRAADAALVGLYRNIGGYIAERVARAEWGERTVESLADYLSIRPQGIKGFSAKNLWRMRQFYVYMPITKSSQRC